MTRIAFLVTHLSGSGHLVRTLALARAAMAAGAEALVISGGRPLPHVPAGGVPLVALPPLRVEGRDFSRMLDAEGREAGPDLLARRETGAAAAVAGFAPHVLVTETWPLGRRRLAREFEAAVAAARAARPGVRLAASVRDLPEPPSRPDRAAAAAARLRDFDALLVHGDAEFLPLSAVWPLPPDLAARTHHTGYVAAPPPPPAPASGEVLVAVGGGDLGRGLLAAAAEAAEADRSRRWRLLVGGADAEAHAAALAARRPGVAAEPARGDYRSLLAGAACSVSLAGYNTVTDLAPLATPAVLVPDETGGEREQAIRAAALAALPGVEVLRGAEVTPQALAAAVHSLAGRPRPPFPIALDGAERSAALLLGLAGGAAA